MKIRPILICALACLGCGSWNACDAMLEAQPLEYQVKAAFLLNFTKFVEWPPSAFAEPTSPVAICILGDDPFGRVLDQMVAGETVSSRKLVIERVHRETLKSCQVLFVGSGEKDVPALLAGLGPGVLTVGEGDDFLQAGGAIAFVLENRRVRFDINPAAAASSGLRLSSRLLSVARSVAK